MLEQFTSLWSQTNMLFDRADGANSGATKKKRGAVSALLVCFFCAQPAWSADNWPTPAHKRQKSNNATERVVKDKKPQAAPSQPTSTRSKGVVVLFAEAQKLYNAGKYKEALVSFDRITKKYPSHEPSTIQYAKTLYRLDRIPESYNLFARINPQYLDPETSYEYGYASYVNQRWDAALFGFKRVPLDHALYDLANYYGALSALKLRKYTEAEEMLDRAEVLPDKLAKSRVLYQKHVQSLKHLQEKSDLQQATAAEKARLNQLKNPNIQPTESHQNPNKPEVFSYKHKGFLVVDRVAKATLSKEHQTIDKHGYSQTTFDNQVGLFSFSHGPIAPLPLTSFNENQSAVGLQLDLNFENRASQGKQERMVAYEDSRDIPRVIGDDIPATQIALGTVGGNAWVEFAIPRKWWLGLSASLSFEYPEFKRGQRTGKRSVSPHLGKMYELGKHRGFILGQFFYEQLTDSETEPLVDAAQSQITSEITFDSGTTVNAQMRAVQYKYHLLTIAGPDATYSGTLSLKQSFPLGINLLAGGTAATHENNIVRGIPSFDTASADGQTLSGRSKIQIVPVDWLTLSAQYDASKTTWRVHQLDREEAFKKNVADYVEQTTFAGSLNFNF